MEYASGDPVRQVSVWFDEWSRALERGDAEAAVSLFSEESYWRDRVAFTWNIKTLEGRAEIEAMLAARLAEVSPIRWTVTEAHATQQNVEGWFTFETAVGRGQGIVHLSDGKCWQLLTTLQELKGFEEKQGPTRPKGVEHGVVRGRISWQARKAKEEASLGYTRQPYCVIIGGGQGGIALAARLKQLEVPTIVVEKNARPGDSWRVRYESLCLHDPVWFDHLPYIPFPDHWPVFSPKDKMGDWLEMYTKVMELNYWHSTLCERATYDEASESWQVDIRRDGQPVELRPKQLVLATGMSGMPHVPKIPGAENFQGDFYHSSRYQSGKAYAGKRCVVLGSGNSAHDICADLWEHGANVTMIQRSATTVIKSETLMELGLGPSYSEEALRKGITTERADLMGVLTPFALAHIGAQVFCRKMKERDADFYRRLAEAGFLLDFGEDETGPGMKYLRRGSGYYIDVGASELIIGGEIRVRSGVGMAEIREQSVVLTDGSELPADLIVLATGYGSMNQWAARLISQEVADRVGKCWGYGSGTRYDPGPWEGELRNMWKPTRQPGLWFHGGNLAQSRQYSLYLALQIKARYEGIPTQVYGLGKVYHLE